MDTLSKIIVFILTLADAAGNRRLVEMLEEPLEQLEWLFHLGLGPEGAERARQQIQAVNRFEMPVMVRISFRLCNTFE